MPRRGIVNVKMVITEEKILSNIEKVQKLINPNSKKQIIELDDNSYFKDLVESIKTYLIEYPKKKNFPKSVYDAAYGLVEFATNLFEENTKQIENLIKQREYNIKSASILKQVLALTESKDPSYQENIVNVSNKFSEDIISALQTIGKAEDIQNEEYVASVKLVNARISNLESNLHIEIDMERVEDRSKALSYIGIEVADALKTIPAPAEDSKKVVETVAKETSRNVQPVVQKAESIVVEKNNEISNNNAYQDFYADTRQQVKPSLWSKFKNSKFAKAFTYIFRVKITLQLPEGTSDSNQIK